MFCTKSGKELGEGAQTYPKKKSSRGRAIGIAFTAAVVSIAVVGLTFGLGGFDSSEDEISPESIPHDVIRGAVMEQLDTDGDIALSQDEDQSATESDLTPEDSGNYVAQRIRNDINYENEANGQAESGQSAPSSPSSGTDETTPSTPSTSGSEKPGIGQSILLVEPGSATMDVCG